MIFRPLTIDSLPNKGFIIVCQERDKDKNPIGLIKWVRSCHPIFTQLYYTSRSQAKDDLNGLVKNNRQDLESIQYFFWISSVNLIKEKIKNQCH